MGRRIGRAANRLAEVRNGEVELARRKVDFPPKVVIERRIGLLSDFVVHQPECLAQVGVGSAGKSKVEQQLSATTINSRLRPGIAGATNLFRKSLNDRVPVGIRTDALAQASQNVGPQYIC